MASAERHSEVKHRIGIGMLRASAEHLRTCPSLSPPMMAPVVRSPIELPAKQQHWRVAPTTVMFDSKVAGAGCWTHRRGLLQHQKEAGTSKAEFGISAVSPAAGLQALGRRTSAASFSSATRSCGCTGLLSRHTCAYMHPLKELSQQQSSAPRWSEAGLRPSDIEPFAAGQR